MAAGAVAAISNRSGDGGVGRGKREGARGKRLRSGGHFHCQKQPLA